MNRQDAKSAKHAKDYDMGLTFTVGNPSDVFVESFASVVTDTLRAEFGDSFVLASTEDAYFTQELGWSGWQMLQERGIDACGAEAIPHFLSMEAWSGAYLPIETAIGSFVFPCNPTPLAIAELGELTRELEAIGLASGLPTDDDSLRELASKYQVNDDLLAADEDIQTFAQLLPCARVARQRNQPLWVVK